MKNPTRTHSTLGPPRWTVPSASEPGKEYTVIADELGRYHCGCKAAEYNRSCWHVAAVKAGMCGKPRVRYMPPQPAPAPPIGTLDDLYGDAPAASAIPLNLPREY